MTTHFRNTVCINYIINVVESRCFAKCTKSEFWAHVSNYYPGGLVIVKEDTKNGHKFPFSCSVVEEISNFDFSPLNVGQMHAPLNPA